MTLCARCIYYNGYHDNNSVYGSHYYWPTLNLVHLLSWGMERDNGAQEASLWHMTYFLGLLRTSQEALGLWSSSA